MEDDEQRSAIAPRQAELQIGEQRFKLASFNRQAMLQIGIAFFFVTGKERERDNDRKRERERERGAEMGWICGDNTEMQRERKRVRDKKNESEKEIGSNEEMETREERER